MRGYVQSTQDVPLVSSVVIAAITLRGFDSRPLAGGPFATGGGSLFSKVTFLRWAFEDIVG